MPVEAVSIVLTTTGSARVVDGRLLQDVVAVPGWVLRWRELPPSQNVLMRSYRNRHKYDQLLAGWEKVIADLMMVGRIPKAAGRRRLEIVRCIRSEKYRLDRGNLVGGCKPVLDAAVRCGLIVDDREDHLDDHYRQAIDADERVEIYVCDL